MENEHARILEVLQTALQMEIDGKEFYEKAAQKSGNELATELFQQLAREEDSHRQKFVEIYEAYKRRQSWPDIEAPSEEGTKLRSLFARATEALGTKSRVARDELEAIKVAIDMEVESFNLYHSRAEQTTVATEKRFYEALAGEERQHQLALSDTYEYLCDPAGWFTKKEHWSLDGA